MPLESLNLPIKYFQIIEGWVIQYESPCTELPFENENNIVIAQFQLNSRLHADLEEIRVNLIDENIAYADITVTLVVDRETEKVVNGMEFIMSLLNLKRRIEQAEIDTIIENDHENENGENDHENENVDLGPVLFKIYFKNGSHFRLAFKNDKDPEIVTEIRDMVKRMREYSEGLKLLSIRRSMYSYFPRSKAKFELFFNDKREITSYSDRWIGPKFWHPNLEEIFIKCCADIGLIAKQTIESTQDENPIQIGKNLWEYTNWNLVDFEDKWVWLLSNNGKRYRFKNNKSRSVFQNIKRVFNLQGFKFRVKYHKGSPINIDLDDSVFEYLDFGLMLRSLRNGQITNFKTTKQIAKFFEKLNNQNKVRQLAAFLGYSKSFYFVCLSQLQIKEDNIKVLLEPSYNHVKNSVDGHEVSFLFQIKANNCCYAVWESLAPGKATYVFRFRSSADCSAGVLAFAHFLRSNSFQGRMALRQTGFGCDLVNEFKYFYHSPNLDQQLQVSEDRSWEDALYEYIK